MMKMVGQAKLPRNLHIGLHVRKGCNCICRYVKLCDEGYTKIPRDKLLLCLQWRSAIFHILLIMLTWGAELGCC